MSKNKCSNLDNALIFISVVFVVVCIPLIISVVMKETRIQNQKQDHDEKLLLENCYGEGFNYNWKGVYIATDHTNCPLPENININYVLDEYYGYYEYYAKPPFKCLDSDCYYKEFYIGGKVYHGVHSQALTPVNN